LHFGGDEKEKKGGRRPSISIEQRKGKGRICRPQLGGGGEEGSANCPASKKIDNPVPACTLVLEGSG